MSLHGIATAIYGSEQESTVSLATLENTGVDQTYIKASQEIKIDTLDIPRVRAAFLTVLDAVCQFRAQMIRLDDGRQALIPLNIVHGVPVDHPKMTYSTMIRLAFPEYFGDDFDVNDTRSVNQLWEHLFLQHYSHHGPIAAAGEQGAKIELHSYALFLPEEARKQQNFQINAEERERALELQEALGKAAAGDGKALNALRSFARVDAMATAVGMQRQGILEKTRFVQMGLHRPEFQQSARYTYLEFFDLRDHFVQLLQRLFAKPHNVCVKTPNAEAAPKFADITTTYLEDLGDFIHFLNTGVQRKKRHVFARKR